MALSPEDFREQRMLAADAARLRDDPALDGILTDLERHATRVAIREFDAPTRERGRLLALAILSLREEINNRIDAVLAREEVRARAFE